MLKRYPHRNHETLQAWDAADELIVRELGRDLGRELGPTLGRTPDPTPGQPLDTSLVEEPVLILNDSFGALSCALVGKQATTYTDSYVSAQGILLNSQHRVQPVHRLEDIRGRYRLALIKIPKSMAFFEDELCRISQVLDPGARVICGYMIKHQAKASFECLERIIGTTTTSLAHKKARLVFANLEREPRKSRFPTQVEIPELGELAGPFTHPSHLFSREGLDIGTRFFLEHLQQLPQGRYRSIVDLGCANGIIGIAAKRLNPEARIVFADDSSMAVECARANYARLMPGSADAEFRWTNCLEGQPPESVDLVLCNPPFHQGHLVADHVAWQMFVDARRALVRGGELRIVGNSHLRHHQALKRIFGNSEVLASNAKFMIARSIKP